MSFNRTQTENLLHVAGNGELIEAVSNGCKVMVTKGGSLLKFYAGMVTNNEGVELHFECGL